MSHFLRTDDFSIYRPLSHFIAALNYTIVRMNSSPECFPIKEPIVRARRLTQELDAEGFPAWRDWETAQAIRFDQDWKGEKNASGGMTEVRLLWSAETLFVQFLAKYKSLTVFPDAREDGWRNQLWDRDVAEVFLQPAGSDPTRYLEFEVSPNGFWIDLKIAPGKKEGLHSGMRRKMSRDSAQKTWTADLALPVKSLTSNFDPKQAWGVNFYRIEGEREPRFYSAWSPTLTEKPNFHVPTRFGTLVFE